MRLIGLLVPALLLPASVATASPARGVLTADITGAIESGADHDVGYFGFDFDGAARLRGPLWAHGRLNRTVGFVLDRDGTGEELDGGLQLRVERGRLCPFIGVDLGYQHLDETVDRRTSGLVLSAGAGVDVRVIDHLSAHLAVAARAVDVDGGRRGGGFSFGLGYTFF